MKSLDRKKLRQRVKVLLVNSFSWIVGMITRRAKGRKPDGSVRWDYGVTVDGTFYPRTLIAQIKPA